MPAMPAPQMTTSAVEALMRRDMVARPARLSTLLDRLDRQLAGRAQRDRVDAVRAHLGRDRLAMQGPHPAPLGFIGVVGELPEARPQVALERGGRALGRVALRDLAFLVEHLALGRPLAIREDSPEQQQRLALERVAGHDEIVLELDHERVDVDLVTIERELTRLADRIALGVELGESHARPRMPLGAGSLVEHDEPGAALGIAQESNGGLERLIALGEGADLRVPLGELPLHLAARRQHHPVGEIDACGRGGHEHQGPEKPHGRSLDRTWEPARDGCILERPPLRPSPGLIRPGHLCYSPSRDRRGPGTPDPDHGRPRHHDRPRAAARGAAAAAGSAVRRRQPPALQAGGARADRRADRAVPGSADRADLHGVDVPARSDPGRALRQGQSESEGRGAQRGAQETRLGRQRQVPGQLPSGPRDDGQPARVDAEAGRRRPRAAEGHDGRDPAAAREGADGGQSEVDRAAEGGRPAGPAAGTADDHHHRAGGSSGHLRADLQSGDRLRNVAVSVLSALLLLPALLPLRLLRYRGGCLRNRNARRRRDLGWVQRRPRRPGLVAAQPRAPQGRSVPRQGHAAEVQPSRGHQQSRVARVLPGPGRAGPTGAGTRRRRARGGPFSRRRRRWPTREWSRPGRGRRWTRARRGGIRPARRPGRRRKRRSSVRGCRARTEPALLQRPRAGLARKQLQRRQPSRRRLFRRRRWLLRWRWTRRWRWWRRSRWWRRRPAMKTARLALAVVLALHGATLAAPAQPAAPAQKSYGSLDEAVNALIAAIRAADRKALVEILGPPGSPLVYSGDDVADRAAFQRFAAAYDRAHRLEGGGGKVVLYVGDDDYPFPIPLVPECPHWTSNTDAGDDELLNRRVGQNELAAIQVCLAYVDAQNEYYSRRTGLLEYAQRLESTRGKRDGLYWEAKPGEQESPLGPLVARARAAGYPLPPSGRPAPYHGYFYRILFAQGPEAPGGAYDFVVKGHMIGGFALVAYPAQYGASGIMTFIVSQDGVVYQKDLGPKTVAAANAIKAYNPDATWDQAEEAQSAR